MGFEELYKEMNEVIKLVILKYNNRLKMDIEDLEQELMLLLYLNIKSVNNADNPKGYFYKTCVYFIYKLELEEHKAGLWLTHSNIINLKEEYDLFDTYTDNDIKYIATDEYVENYKKKRLEYSKQYYKEHKDERALYNKEYYQKNKEQFKEKKREYNKEYYKKNKEQLKEKQREYKKEYYQKNKEKLKEYSRTYYKKKK